MKVYAVVVTYNRKQLMSECLEAIKKQTLKPERIIIIDNHSTDGTYDFLSERGFLTEDVEYIYMEKNLGGAGGFHAGVKKGYEEGAEWLWIMDDDTIPEQGALQAFAEARLKLPENVSYMASSVFGENGEAMNVPSIASDNSENGYPDWYQLLDQGIVRITSATFVSLCINAEAVRCCGLPFQEYFIWGDDIEYTLRITSNYGPGYMIGNSKVIHKRKITKIPDILSEIEASRIKMHYYSIRNNLVNIKEYYGDKAAKSVFKHNIKNAVKILLGNSTNKGLKLRIIAKALWDYKLGKYDADAFARRFTLDMAEK